jgi:hypothetical protein
MARILLMYESPHFLESMLIRTIRGVFVILRIRNY